MLNNMKITCLYSFLSLIGLFSLSPISQAGIVVTCEAQYAVVSWPLCEKPNEAYDGTLLIIKGEGFTPGLNITRVILVKGGFQNNPKIEIPLGGWTLYPNRKTMGLKVGDDGKFILNVNTPRNGVSYGDYTVRVQLQEILPGIPPCATYPTHPIPCKPNITYTNIDAPQQITILAGPRRKDVKQQEFSCDGPEPGKCYGYGRFSFDGGPYAHVLPGRHTAVRLRPQGSNSSHDVVIGPFILVNADQYIHYKDANFTPTWTCLRSNTNTNRGPACKKLGKYDLIVAAYRDSIWIEHVVKTIEFVPPPDYVPPPPPAKPQVTFRVDISRVRKQGEVGPTLPITPDSVIRVDFRGMPDKFFGESCLPELIFDGKPMGKYNERYLGEEYYKKRDPYVPYNMNHYIPSKITARAQPYSITVLCDTDTKRYIAEAQVVVKSSPLAPVIVFIPEKIKAGAKFTARITNLPPNSTLTRIYWHNAQGWPAGTASFSPNIRVTNDGTIVIKKILPSEAGKRLDRGEPIPPGTTTPTRISNSPLLSLVAVIAEENGNQFNVVGTPIDIEPTCPLNQPAAITLDADTFDFTGAGGKINFKASNFNCYTGLWGQLTLGQQSFTLAAGAVIDAGDPGYDWRVPQSRQTDEQGNFVGTLRLVSAGSYPTDAVTGLITVTTWPAICRDREIPRCDAIDGARSASATVRAIPKVFIWATPGKLKADEQLQITWKGFTPNVQGQVSLDRDDQIILRRYLDSGEPLSVTIPAKTPTGRHMLKLDDGQGHTSTTQIEVTAQAIINPVDPNPGPPNNNDSKPVNDNDPPSVTVTPNPAAQGQEVKISAKGFSRNSLLTIYFDKNQISGRADYFTAPGFEKSYKIPLSQPNGPFVMKVTDIYGKQAQVIVEIRGKRMEPTILLAKQNGLPGKTILLNGKNWNKKATFQAYLKQGANHYPLTLVSNACLSWLGTGVSGDACVEDEIRQLWQIPDTIPAGDYRFILSDGANLAEATFKILAPKAASENAARIKAEQGGGKVTEPTKKIQEDTARTTTCSAGSTYSVTFKQCMQDVPDKRSPYDGLPCPPAGSVPGYAMSGCIPQ